MISPTLVLHVAKYADDKLIAETYTATQGAQSFLIRISHGGRKSSVPHTLFQPLALLNVEWTESRRSTLIKPTAALPLHIPYGIQGDPVRTALALFLADILRAILRNEPSSPELFSYCEYAIRWLDAADERSVSNFHIAFLVRLTHLLGIAPSKEEVSAVCPAIYQPYTERLLRINLSNQHLYRFTRQQRAEFLRLILLYYHLHLPSFPELKSVEVLTELFN